MMASRGMGAIRPSKIPKGIRKQRRDNTDFTEYKKGGDVSIPKMPKGVKAKREGKRQAVCISTC